MNLLEQLRQLTKIVIDTGDIEAIKAYQPLDATTNPSLVMQAAQNPKYHYLIKDAVEFSKKNAPAGSDKQRTLMMDRVFVNFGTEILKLVPGRVSTEVDARLSFDVEGSIQKARDLIALYALAGIPKERVLIKLASTWEGASAARKLEKEGIHCNMTLMFSLPQAIACAEAGATLISPFVGRILDWFKKNEGVSSYPPAEDPGVKSVTQIYNYYKKFGYKTVIMGASFRNKEQILELAGCDLLTISPQLLQELTADQGKVERKLDPANALKLNLDKISIDEKAFRYGLNENAMATEKLAEGIRKFAEDAAKLEKMILDQFML